MEIALVPEGEGALAITACPGRWADLAEDFARLRAAGASATLTLLGDAELAALGVPGLGAAARAAGLSWWQVPLTDFGVPGPAFRARWTALRATLHRILDGGGTLHLHCRAGLGRSGTVAALLLVERGWQPKGAIAWVRAHRPGAVETAGQQACVAGWLSAGGRTWP
jgi:hypothetical protein